MYLTVECGLARVLQQLVLGSGAPFAFLLQQLFHPVSIRSKHAQPHSYKQRGDNKMYACTCVASCALRRCVVS